MAEFSLSIVGMMAYPTKDALSDVVFQVCWSYEGTDGTFTTAMSGTTDVPSPDPQDYIPYSDLTEPVVMGWVQQYTDPAVWVDYEQKMTAWLAAQHNPPVVNPPLPWSTPETGLPPPAEA